MQMNSKPAESSWNSETDCLSEICDCMSLDNNIPDKFWFLIKIDSSIPENWWINNIFLRIKVGWQSFNIQDVSHSSYGMVMRLHSHIVHNVTVPNLLEMVCWTPGLIKLSSSISFSSLFFSSVFNYCYS